VQLVEQHDWETPTGWSRGWFDSRGRVWLPTRAYRSPTGADLVYPGTMAQLRAFATHEREWLLLGAIEPHELAHAPSTKK
jgi:hypothetical protein